MQKLVYEEILQDNQSDARNRERMALDRSIDLLVRAAQPDATSADIAQAIVFTGKLWALLVEDLAAPDNGLPRELRAQIVSIGIWIMRELERLRSDPTVGFADLIQVSKAIRDGLV